jgi:rhamnose transport system substrate-binding protein
MNLKRVLRIVVVLISMAATSLFAAGRNDSGKSTYFINPKMTGAAYWRAAEQGAKKAGEDLNVDIIWNGTSDVDAAAQVNMISDMLVRNVKGMAVAVNDATSVTNVFQQAAGKNIPVVTFDSDSSNAQRAYYIAGDTDESIGLAFLDALIRQMPEPKGKIAVMIASPSAANIIAWRDVALAKISSNYPDIQIVGVYASGDSIDKAYENASSFIPANPDLAGILCLAGGETPSACKAVEEAVAKGILKPGQVKIGGMGIPSLVKEYIKNGTMTTSVMWNPMDLGYLAVWTVDQLVKGNPITNGQVVPGITNPIKVIGDTIYSGTFTFTSADVDQYPF